MTLPVACAHYLDHLREEPASEPASDHVLEKEDPARRVVGRVHLGARRVGAAERRALRVVGHREGEPSEEHDHADRGEGISLVSNPLSKQFEAENFEPIRLTTMGASVHTQ